MTPELIRYTKINGSTAMMPVQASTTSVAGFEADGIL